MARFGTYQPCALLSLEKPPVGSTQSHPERQPSEPVTASPLRSQVPFPFCSRECVVQASEALMEPGRMTECPVVVPSTRSQVVGWRAFPNPPRQWLSGKCPQLLGAGPWSLMTVQDWWSLCHCFPDVTHPHPHFLPRVFANRPTGSTPSPNWHQKRKLA